MKLWNKLKEWWNKPSYWEQVKEKVENREPCVRLSFTFQLEDGETVTNYLEGPECEKYFRHLNYTIHGSQHYRWLLSKTKWNWKRETKTVD